MFIIISVQLDHRVQFSLAFYYQRGIHFMLLFLLIADLVTSLSS